MAITKSSRTYTTKSGVIVREDSGLNGLLCFTHASGLAYAVAQSDMHEVLQWLNGERKSPPSPIYGSTLGIGWAKMPSEAEFPMPQLLPSIKSWPVVTKPARPILINWLITGRCPLACKYCYAEDLMRNDLNEPDADRIVTTAESVLELNPLVVVLTGGDPLFTSNLKVAVESLSGKVGIVVDTSGYTLRSDHIELFKKHKVSMRISIDSQVPRVHEAQRPVSSLYPKFRERGDTLKVAIEALCIALDAGIGVVVQTVATKKTANDLVSLGDTLFRLGVQAWRIFKVAPSITSMSGYKSLVGSHTDDGRPYKGKRAKGPYEHAFANVLAAWKGPWMRKMALQLTLNETPNSVILVSPDGRFLTESNTGSGKILLDAQKPRKPRLSSIASIVDMEGHSARYLNLTTNVFDELDREYQ
jgi:sulfatase maturation enzyme AslB (radical SAM superfamily)